MYCGNCFRDNALVAELRKEGHETLMIPLYLPMTLDEEDSSSGTPIFFSGINVYLEQQSSFFRHMPNWLHRWLASPLLLKWASGRAAKTRPEDVGELTLSMFRGEEGNQARELEELIMWLKTYDHPDVVCISNALLIGLVRRIREELNCPVVCMLQGEDSFLDCFPDKQRKEAWDLLTERAKDVDLFISPSRYYADRMKVRLGLDDKKLNVVPNGIHLDGFHSAEKPPARPTIGYFARQCKEKGLDTLVDAFITLKKRGSIADLQLRVGGGMGPNDESFVAGLKAKLDTAGVLDSTEFHPNLSREQKQSFYSKCTVFSVPAMYGEAFGLYLLESLASRVPVVQPDTAAFPEIVKGSDGGMLYDPAEPDGLANALEKILTDRKLLEEKAANGLASVQSHYSVEAMAKNMTAAFDSVGAGRK